MTATLKVIVTAAMFAVTAALVFVASATNSTAPLFAMFLPLLVVPWALTRPEPGEAVEQPAVVEQTYAGEAEDISGRA